MAVNSSLHHLHHLLWEINVGIVPLNEAAFTDSELTLPLSGTLDQIGAEPGVTVAGLARVQPKTPQAISQLVAKLEKMGLVQRQLGSGRGVGLHLTEAGAAARADAVAREAWIEARLRETLGEELSDELATLLERVRLRLRDIDTTTTLKVSDLA